MSIPPGFNENFYTLCCQVGKHQQKWLHRSSHMTDDTHETNQALGVKVVVGFMTLAADINWACKTFNQVISNNMFSFAMQCFWKQSF